MARIAGVNLPDAKKVKISLTAIYGVGRRNVMPVLKEARVDPDKKAADLTSQEITRLTKAIEAIPTEGNLRKQLGESIKRLKTIGSYRGQRHNLGLPARGQRTRSNARTKRGKRQTIGAMRKKDLTKLEGGQKTGKEEDK